MSSAKNHYSEGKAAVAVLWKRWRERPKIDDPRHPDFAKGVLDEIVRRLKNSDDIDKEIREYSEAAAEQVTSAQRTIFEIMQNADDLAATNLKLSVRKQNGGELLAVHDGKWVEAADVIAMTLAFLSLKRDDAGAKGRFGIGLKTLNQIGSRLAVHSPPYHFEINKGNLRRIEPYDAIGGLYEGTEGETLLCVSLDGEYGLDDVRGWIDQLDPMHLIFLDTLKGIFYFPSQSHSAVVVAAIDSNQLGEVEIELRPGHNFQVSQASIVSDNRRWTRYSLSYPVPKSQKRAHKATGVFTELSIAVSETGEPGLLSAGLPLDIDATLPISLNAQFDPDLARRGLQNRTWNKWLFERLSELISGVALQRFRTNPKTAWQAVPLREEGESSDRWEEQQISTLISTAQERIHARARVMIRERKVLFDEIAYPGVGLTKLLSEDDIRYLVPDRYPLPASYRDAKGRWRMVLDEIANGNHVEIKEALGLLQADEDVLGTRSADWFIGIAKKAIDEQLERELNTRPALLGADEAKYVPHSDCQFVRERSETGVAFELGLEVELHPQYFSAGCPKTVSEWITDRCIGSSEKADENTLKALSRRNQDDPLFLDENSLLSVRDVLQSLDDDKRETIAKRIGRVVLVDGFEYQKGKKIPSAVRPAEAYLPTQIAKDTGGWAAAAKLTEKINWIDPKYTSLFKISGSTEMGAKKFFLLLGARAGPRLQRNGGFGQKIKIPSEIPAMQFDCIQLVNRANEPTHLANDWISSDLDNVVADIVRQKVDAKRRSRSSALLETLMREWDSYLEDKATADGQFHYYSWKSAGALPATWLAACASEPWLSSKSNRKVAPREIAIESAATKLTRGTHKSHFAYEISEVESNHPLIKALEIAGTPSTSELINSLKDLKALSGSRTRQKDVIPFYVSISAKIQNDRIRKIGEMDIDKFRQTFDSHELLLTNLGWQSPRTVYRGRPIFGSKRGFVAETKILDKLWGQLQISGPTVEMCIDVLSEIADEGKAPEQPYQAIIVDGLRWLAESTVEFSARQRQRLTKLPLWTSKGWQINRPIFAFSDASAENSIKDDVAIWQPNCSMPSLQNLPVELGVEIVSESDFVVDSSLKVERADNTTIQLFRAAISRLRDELGKKGDQTLRHIDWATLAKLELLSAPQLAAQVKLAGKTHSVVRNIHVEQKMALYFRHEDDLKDPDAGVRILSQFAAAQISEMAGYVWNYSWAQAEFGIPSTALILAENENEEAFDPIAKMLRAGKNLKGSKLHQGKNDKKGRRGKKKLAPRPKARELKNFDEATITGIGITTESGKTISRTRARSPLIANPQKNPSTKSASPLSPSIKNWGELEREQLGFQILAAALKGIDDTELEDFSSLRRIGADSIDNLKRYFELKVHSGDAPEEVRFEPSEFERAAIEGKSYYLAVISGLEVGKKTEIRIFADPIRTLPWRRVSQIRLGGIRTSANALAITISASSDD